MFLSALCLGQGEVLLANVCAGFIRSCCEGSRGMCILGVSVAPGSSVDMEGTSFAALPLTSTESGVRRCVYR